MQPRPISVWALRAYRKPGAVMLGPKQLGTIDIEEMRRFVRERCPVLAAVLRTPAPKKE